MKKDEILKIKSGAVLAGENSTLPTLAARRFAIEAHGDQQYGDLPYSVHLDEVAELLIPYGELAQTVGYLHDVVEDTGVNIETVKHLFGDRVAKCVALITDETGANRTERKARTNAKLSAVSGEHEIALVVKAADRLANILMSTRSGSVSKLDMYRSEYQEFRNAVYRPELCEELWCEIDSIMSKRK